MLSPQQLSDLELMFYIQSRPAIFCIDPGYLDRELSVEELEQIGNSIWALTNTSLVISMQNVQKIYFRTALINNMGDYSGKWAEIPIIPLN